MTVSDFDSLTVPEAARALKVTPRTIRNLEARGELTVVKVGRASRVLERDLEAYLRRSRGAGEHAGPA